jgi:3-hydroxyacyl-[acyl-carrier-protein] dehydratase
VTHPDATPPYAVPLPATDSVGASEQDDHVRVVARKKVVSTDPYLAGHFPGRLVYPGVFVIETVRQAVISALGDPAGGGDRRFLDVTAIRSVRFVGALHEGDELTVEAEVRGPDGEGVLAVEARCRRNGAEDVARLAMELGYDGEDDGADDRED